MRTAIPLLAGTLSLVICTSTGCGEGDADLVPVEGKVTLNGQPLPSATVMISQLRATAPGPFAGETDSDGRFKLGSTASAGSGAAIGEYTVYITTVKFDPNIREGAPRPADTPKEVVPLAFRDGSTRFSVPEGGTQNADFAMRSN